MSIIEVSNLSFGYAEAEVLADISFEVEGGTFLAIAGPNGVGKSTLLNLLCGSLKPNSGMIKIDGAAIESYSPQKLAEKVAIVRQEFVPAFGFSVIETVLMARTPYFGQMGFESEADRAIANEALAMTDTTQFASRLLAELSGGERQRVFIARALTQNTPILLLDEPTSFLDLKHQVGIYDLLRKLQHEKNKTIIAVTHDINLAIQYSDVALLIAGADTYSGGTTTEVLSPEHIERVFNVKTLAFSMGREKFIIPLGKFGKNTSSITQKPETDK